MRIIVSIFIGIIIIYGMFFLKYHLSDSTDKTYNVLGLEKKFEDSENVIMKKNLTFTDGLNNGTRLLGISIKNFFVGCWEFSTLFTPYISALGVNILIKLPLYILTIIPGVIISVLVTLLYIVIFFYKLLFFKASLFYYAGFCASFFGILFISRYADKGYQGGNSAKNLAS
ncbi:hypothetical protein [Priestia aryabhattai]|uniref:hypothetical protein n=1 Tax=Priestia aryabhattai TaxID=412384 RepID=UPI0032E8E4AD